MDKGYIDFLKAKFAEMKNSGEVLDKDLLHFPDLIKLLCDILDEDEVDKDSRLMVCAALGYLVAPNDVVPEDVYGSYGYMDDLYVACVVLDGIKSRYPDLLSKLWNYDDDLDLVLESCTAKGERFLEERGLKERLLRYCGLEEGL